MKKLKSTVKIVKEQKIVDDVPEQPTFNIHIDYENTMISKYLFNLTVEEVIGIRDNLNAIKLDDLSTPTLE